MFKQIKIIGSYQFMGRIFFMISLLGTLSISNAADTEIFGISNTVCDVNGSLFLNGKGIDFYND